MTEYGIFHSVKGQDWVVMKRLEKDSAEHGYLLEKDTWIGIAECPSGRAAVMLKKALEERSREPYQRRATVLFDPVKISHQSNGAIIKVGKRGRLDDEIWDALIAHFKNKVLEGELRSVSIRLPIADHRELEVEFI